MKDSRILLVEDEALVGIELKSSLQRLGYTKTELVKSGEEACDQVSEKSPDLVLMDVNLAGSMDGIEATQKIHEEYGNVPVVFITAYSSDSIIDRIRETDAYGYIIKPIDDSDLETITQSVLEDQQVSGIDNGRFLMRWLRELKQAVTVLNPTVPRIPV